MCGISGCAGQGWTRDQLERMIAVMSHRGPDNSGSYFSPGGLIALGHNRLSIIDLSDAGNQPIVDSTGNLHLVFNGEVYNYLELRAELADYPYQSQADTEVVLAAYQKWGEACLDHFIGMFAFIIWDEDRQRYSPPEIVLGSSLCFTTSCRKEACCWPARSKRCMLQVWTRRRTRWPGQLTWQRVCTTIQNAPSGRGYIPCSPVII